MKQSKINKSTSQGRHQTKFSSFQVACAAAMLLLCAVSSGFADSEPERRFPLLFNMVHHNPGEPQFVTHYDEPGYPETTWVQRAGSNLKHPVRPDLRQSIPWIDCGTG